MSTKPNILILLSDQHRAEAMAYAGNPDVHTPNFDKMVREGFSYNNCLSCHPLCAPFRATLQTGKYPFTHGVVFNDETVDYTLPNLAGQFRAENYATAFFGKGHWTRKVKPGYLKPEERLNWEHWIGWNNGHEDYDLPTFDEQNNPWLIEDIREERPAHDEWGDFKHEYANLFAPGVQTQQLKSWVEGLEPDQPWVAQVNWGPPHNISNSKGFNDPETMALSKKINQDLELGIPDHLFDNYVTWLTTFPQHLVSPMVPQHFLNMYELDKISVPENVPEAFHTLVRHQLKGYYAQITALDDLTGRVMEWLKQTGRDKNTIVMYTSDHGDYLGSHANEATIRSHGRGIRGKGSPFACNTQVPMILWGPEHIQAGQSTSTPIGTVDLLPTLCGLADIPCDPSMPGKNLADWGRQGEGCKENPLLLSMRNWRAWFDGQYLYSIFSSPEGTAARHLFDFTNDPLNLNNLVDDPAHAELRQQLHQQMTAKMTDLADPFPL